MTRFSSLSPLIARCVAAVLAAVLALSIYAVPSAISPPSQSGAEPAGSALDSDAGLYRSIAAKVGAGQPYYTAMADEHRANGYPLQPVMAVRLPTLAWVSGALGPNGTQWLMLSLILLTLLIWFRTLRPRLGFPVTAGAVMVMTLSLIPFTYAPLPLFHESWGGLLVALALGLWRKDAPWASIAVALIAALLRETAMPLLAMMAFLAVFSRRWKEAIAWGAAMAIWGIAYTFHYAAVAAILRPDDLASSGWSGMGGWPLFVDAVAKTTPLSLLPLAVAGPLTALSLFGWLSLRCERGLHVAGWLLGMAAMIMLFARPDNFYWAALPAPLLLAGLTFVPTAAIELWKAARVSIKPPEPAL